MNKLKRSNYNDSIYEALSNADKKNVRKSIIFSIIIGILPLTIICFIFIPILKQFIFVKLVLIICIVIVLCILYFLISFVDSTFLYCLTKLEHIEFDFKKSFLSGITQISTFILFVVLGVVIYFVLEYEILQL